MGVWVVKSTEDPRIKEQKLSFRSLLGMNIIRRCYHERFVQLGRDLFQFPLLKSATRGWKEALLECHSIELLNEQRYLGKGKIKGQPVRIPASQFISIVSPSSATATHTSSVARTST